ncbi:hypothetical protein [Streptomyces sp. JV176]|uniref:hypothetical protein n=1 Tax=Streptomyces sp. JV176 TaxID=858630 RepID=UPI002E76C701|nr:hypothetical protein [Streptomyces sp. JV176]
MRTTAAAEGIVHSGRAMAGLFAAVRDRDIRPGQRSVFRHTGGLPGLFGHPETVHRAVTAPRSRTLV